ncbi:beta strand repeat-containing protein [Geminisphaera colitermitum]|uniref:beta strand repeat-containing protein n=1 Tax=Geminisphaera colitermitum TaxID=1148786 RepID=UPI000158D51D|nr:autotransporter-associated beta strand repeat-containing protein [Geminisphaera colitermitum]
MNAFVVSPCRYPAFARRLIGGALALLSTGFSASLGLADETTPSLTINPGETKYLADLNAAGITDASQIHFLGAPAMHDTSPATLDLSNLTDNLALLGYLTIGDYPGAGDIPPSVNTSWTRSYAGHLAIADGKTFQARALFIGSGSRFTSTGSGTLRLADLRIFDGAIATLTNLQLTAATPPITNYGGDLTLRYTTDMTIRPMSLDFPLVSTPSSGPPPVTPSKTTMDVDANVTVMLPSYGVINSGRAQDLFVKTGAGTLVLNGPYAPSNRFNGTYVIDNGIVQIAATNNNSNTLGTVLSRLTFRGDATAPDSAAPRIAIKDSDVTFSGTSSSQTQRLVIGTYDTASSTWTETASGGFTIAEGKTLTIDNATYGATPDAGGAVQVGEGSRFVADGGGTFVLSNNRAQNGGALHAGRDSNVTLTNAIFTNNTAAISGGAIYNDRANLTLNYTQDAVITGNQSNEDGMITSLSTGFISMRGGTGDLTGVPTPIEGGPAITTLNVAQNKTVTIGSAATPTKDGISGINQTIFNKDGAGTLNLFSKLQVRTININAGTLLLNGNTVMPGTSNAGGALNIASGATLGGHGTIGGQSANFPIVAQNGARIQIGHTGDTSAATLDISFLYLGNGGVTLAYDLFANNTADLLKSNIRLTSVPVPGSGPATPAPADNPNIIEINNASGVGTYQIVRGTIRGLATSADINNYFTLSDLAAGGRITGTFSHTSIGPDTTFRNDLHVTLSVANSPALIWTGATDATWAADAKTNWRIPATDALPAAQRFINGDRVQLDSTDTAGNRDITIAAEGVTASELIVSGSGNYTLTGGPLKITNDTATFAAGTISADATGKLIKTGTGTLTLANLAIDGTDSNNFANGTDLRGGTLAIMAPAHLGSFLNKLSFQGDVATDAAAPTRLAILNPTNLPRTIEFACPDAGDVGGIYQRLVIGDADHAYAGGITLAEKTALRIRGNRITGDNGDIDGAALHVATGSKFTVEGGDNFHLASNRTRYGKGGAIYAGRGARLDLANARFTTNSAAQGGAIYNDAADITLRYDITNPNLINLLAAENNRTFPTTEPASGGFLYMNGSASNGMAKTTFNIATGNTVRIGVAASDGNPTPDDSIASTSETGAHAYNTLVKKGAGTLVINSDSSAYHGHTSHEAGELVINGILGSSLHTLDIASGATLKGVGRINGSITLNAGATIAPGNSPGTLTFENLVLEGGSILQFEVGDKIVITGDLTFTDINAGNQVVLDLSGYNLATPYTSLDLLTIAGDVGIIGSTLDVSNAFRVIGLADGLTATFDLIADQTNILHLTLATTSVPEPVTTALFLAGMSIGAAFALRRKQKK